MVEKIFKSLWQDYTQRNPKAKKLYELLLQREGQVLNDHIALRTYSIDEINVDKMAQSFLDLGYEEKGSYTFEAKKLTAKHYESENQNYPKVFISQLELKHFSPQFVKSIEELVFSVDPQVYNTKDLCLLGRPWSLEYSLYTDLLKDSEYAAWLAAFGFRANHFTVNVNELKTLKDLPELNEFVKSQNYLLNSSGGEVKGSPEVYLEQSSTLAEAIDVEFKDKTVEIPSCYYEFAYRYPTPDGQLYQGFVANSADKIFESTDTKAL